METSVQQSNGSGGAREVGRESEHGLTGTRPGALRLLYVYGGSSAEMGVCQPGTRVGPRTVSLPSPEDPGRKRGRPEAILTRGYSTMRATGEGCKEHRRGERKHIRLVADWTIIGDGIRRSSLWSIFVSSIPAPDGGRLEAWRCGAIDG